MKSFTRNLVGSGIAPCVSLADIDPQYKVVDVSFMKVYGAVGTIPTFKLDPEIGLTESQFIDQISELNRQGRSVLIALGGDGIYIEGLGWIAQNNDNLKQEFIYHIADALANGTNGFTKIPHDKLALVDSIYSS